MNREIKFRAWDGRFMINPYCELKDDNHFWGEDLVNTPYVTPIAVMQYTGLKDKNGKEIYEGDIIKVIHEEGLNWQRTHVDIGVLEFSDQGYFLVKCIAEGSKNAKDIKKRYFYISFKPKREFEVIGNIHENPELSPK